MTGLLREALRAGLALALGITWFTTTAAAQTDGQINGLVTDVSGAAVSGVNVTVTNTGTHQERSTVANDSGQYSFPALLPGVYHIKVERQGFTTTLRSGVE